MFFTVMPTGYGKSFKFQLFARAMAIKKIRCVYVTSSRTRFSKYSMSCSPVFSWFRVKTELSCAGSEENKSVVSFRVLARKVLCA